ncbi:acyl-CoA dehydrogenase [Verticiella sediminum]|uniref:Acyl-CoA dehydrogenase n=1 Tax=Verticiella sediminum TaxID=1247510 RepID=A0A556AJJ0_9BURK|nr:acyl-CoA dehydrogenase family protein [Verticiella sediminum]TSH93046.1 acyl-CoA dehydrogenase [Verticiella sediminum]
MNFEITEEQRQLRDSLRRLLEKEYPFAGRRRILAEEPGWSRQVWRQLGELGVTALGVPSELGGLDGDALDRLPVHVELGRVLSLEPYLGSTVLGGTLARAVGGAYAADVLPGLCTGHRLLAVAHSEPGARHAECWVRTRAEQADGAWRLHGVKTQVLHGDAAPEILVSARISGGPADADGLGIFRLDPAAAGVGIAGLRLADRSPAARLHLEAAPAQLLAEGAAAASALRAMRRAGIAAACAEGLGVMQGAFELAVAYLGERRQFGAPIGTYQALRHRVAEMKVAVETARSAAIAAAWALVEAHEERIDVELARAKILLGRQGTFVTQQAIQLHGGIGMTEEYAVGHYLRRLTVLDQLFGDAAHHAANLGRCLRAAA